MVCFLFQYKLDMSTNEIGEKSCFNYEKPH